MRSDKEIRSGGSGMEEVKKGILEHLKAKVIARLDDLTVEDLVVDGEFVDLDVTVCTGAETVAGLHGVEVARELGLEVSG